MPTPKAGTVRQPDVEVLSSPSKKEWFKDLPLTIWLALLSAVSCVYCIISCALGRFFLDHFHLWPSRYTVPSDAPSLDKHAELIAALVAGCLTGPATFGAIILFYLFGDILIPRHMPSVLGRLPLLGICFFVILVLLAILGAMFHMRFRYLTVVTILATYGFGSLFLLSGTGISFYLWNRYFRIRK
ncbi:hypothetical protein DL96DRAFT_1643326 [Flagelloscypha sp. PMI_526]|nr:hypothetical protein DL96DRAFT_1643326 [Flagelloscypha sp. PMI_526]